MAIRISFAIQAVRSARWSIPRPVDPVLSILSRHLLLVWIEGSEAHTEELIRRFDRAPKPMYYRPEFLSRTWEAYLAETDANPDARRSRPFVRFAYARAMAHRQPLYADMARWGISIAADDVAKLRTPPISRP
jgi:hypothetical protein